MVRDFDLLVKIKEAEKTGDRAAYSKAVMELQKKWEHFINKMYNLYRDRSQLLGLSPSFEDYKADANTALIKAINNVDLSKIPDPDKWCFYAPLWGYLKREISTSIGGNFKEAKHSAFSLDEAIDDEGGTAKANLVSTSLDPYQEFERKEFRDAIDEAIQESFIVFSGTQKKIYGFLTSNEKVSKKRQMELLKITPAEYRSNLAQVRSTIKVNLARACNKRHIPQIHYQGSSF